MYIRCAFRNVWLYEPPEGLMKTFKLTSHPKASTDFLSCPCCQHPALFWDLKQRAVRGCSPTSCILPLLNLSACSRCCSASEGRLSHSACPRCMYAAAPRRADARNNVCLRNPPHDGYPASGGTAHPGMHAPSRQHNHGITCLLAR